jgi:hypothetical protein
MTITLTFDSVEEAEEARTALDGHKYKIVLWELDQMFRQCVKYNNSFMDKTKPATDAEIDIADKLREILRDYLQEYNINID